jgi:hypothetical protein
MPDKQFFKKLSWRHYAIVVATLVLVVLIVFPDRVVLDRNILILLGIIVVLALWPTLKSGKIPYIMEIKRKAAKKK